MEEILYPHEAPPTSNKPDDTGDVPMATSSAESLAQPILKEAAERADQYIHTCYIRENLPVNIPIETNERALEDLFVNLITLSKETARKMADGFVLDINYDSIVTEKKKDKYLKVLLDKTQNTTLILVTRNYKCAGKEISLIIDENLCWARTFVPAKCVEAIICAHHLPGHLGAKRTSK